MLIGTHFTYEEIKNVWLKLHPEDSEKFNKDSEKYDEYCIFHAAYNLAEELGLHYAYAEENYDDEYVLGLPYDNMELNETRIEFEKRILKILNKIFTVDKVQPILDSHRI
jgi:hypothetical protein